VRIGELSRRSGVSARSLRYYEEHGLITSERGHNGYRDYSDDAVDAARNLQLLFRLGIDRELARSVLACSGEVPAETHRATRDQLTDVRDRMIAQIQELSAARVALDDIISRID
jgi:DNA-binding transcriptional MerR regulator